MPYKIDGLSPIEHLQRIAIEGAVNVQAHMTEPDDDWQPMFFVWSGDGKAKPVIMAAIDSEFFRDGMSREALCIVMTGLIQENNGKAACFLSSTWVSERPELGRPADDPDRKEQVMVISSDDERLIGSFAFIERHEDGPPTLAEWEQCEGPDLGGMFADVLREALTP